MPRFLPVLIAFLLLVPAAAAQAPDQPHRTLTTEHFRVHFTPELEPLARRAAASAERAYTRLAAELVAPRGPIDLVVADNVDYANGSATVFPSNRIVVYAHPPIESPALRFTDDWIDLVVTHELAHIFHIDRSRGVWRGLQYVFGRSPILFPNAYTPRWLSEGIATYYESRLTGSGRIAGTTHAAYANAAALEGRLPRIDQLSLATPVFPGGQGVYIYGSLFVDHIARMHGADKVRALIERQAVHPLPFMLNRVARASTGRSFSAEWNEFTEALDQYAGEASHLDPAWRDLSPPSFSAEFLRWMGTDTLVYTGAAPRELFGAYRVHPDGTRSFLGRRNGVTPHSRTADGTLVYAQPDFTDPFSVRGDLYLERRGRARRVTKGARISAPDARPDGLVVAVQAVTGGSRLVLHDIATGALRAITSGGPDEFWAEPRWSPTGDRIAAVQWRRGGTSAIIILDPAGAVVEEISVTRAVQSSPSWSPDGRRVLFTSDMLRSSMIYMAYLDVPHEVTGRALERISGTTPAMYEPQFSPDSTFIAAVRLGAEGLVVGVMPVHVFLLPGLPPFVRAPATPVPARLDTVTPFPGESRRYSPLRQLLPRFWFPLFEDDRVDTRFGAYTSSSDILDRHAYVAQLAVPLRGRGVEGGISYQYAGLARPLIGVAVWQNWTHLGSVLRPDSTPAARLDRVERDAAISAVFRRPRVRSNLTASISAGAQVRRNSLSPEVPTNAPLGFFVDSVLPRVSAGIGYARTVSAPYAISPEDGFTASVGAINHWIAGFAAPSSRTAIGVVTGYRSLDLGGYARHVAALRLAAGGTDVNSVNELRAGGVSGGTIPLAFGLGAIGEGRRNFFVRGFEDGALKGTRAWAASAEYRAPLAMFARGAGLLPLFLDRTSVSGFADAASAWCPEFVTGLCYQSNPKATIGSVGAEARLVAALGSWDAPFAFRLGVAVPVLEPERAPDRATVYFTSGLSF